MKITTIAPILNAEIHDETLSFARVSINTRTLQAGDLFVAVRGANFDAHDFLLEAEQKGAVAAIVDRDVQCKIPLLKVADTTQALGQLGKFWRSQFNLPVIGVTGSCGKTTTKNILATILSQIGETLSSEKSFNNAFGVPLALLQMKAQHRFAVIEIGANNFGEIAYISEIAKPNIAVITNVGYAHLAGFSDIEGVAKAKNEIYRSLDKHGTAIVNLDDDFANYWLKTLSCENKLTFGIKNKADFMAENISYSNSGRPSFVLQTPKGSAKVDLQLRGEHNVMNALAAAAAAFAAGISVDAIADGLMKSGFTSMRLAELSGVNGSIIINDAYNANPSSSLAALQVLDKYSGKKIFVCGDMLELGPSERRLHMDLGMQAQQLSIDSIYGYGELGGLVADSFGEGGYAFTDKKQLLDELRQNIDADTVVLVKGSRGAKMEEIVEALKA